MFACLVKDNMLAAYANHPCPFLSLPNVVILIFVNSQVVKEQPLWMDVPQVVTFSSVIELLKAMSLTPHAHFELKSLEYGAITIELVNCLPTKFNGDILFELPLVCHLLGHSKQLQGMNRKYDGHFLCKL
jgi:hypothetical protein